MIVAYCPLVEVFIEALTASEKMRLIFDPFTLIQLYSLLEEITLHCALVSYLLYSCHGFYFLLFSVTKQGAIFCVLSQLGFEKIMIFFSRLVYFLEAGYIMLQKSTVHILLTSVQSNQITHDVLKLS